MTSRVLFVLAMLLTTSCGFGSLSEAECREAGRKELAYVSQVMAGEDDEGLAAIVAPQIEQGVKRCIAGDGYNRSDYKCLMAAETPDETRTCLESANTQINY